MRFSEFGQEPGMNINCRKQFKDYKFLSVLMKLHHMAAARYPLRSIILRVRGLCQK